MPGFFVGAWFVRLVDRVPVLWPTLAGGCCWCACFGSSIGLMACLFCGNGEWGRRPDTQSTSPGGVFGVHLVHAFIATYSFGCCVLEQPQFFRH
jgi:hypothetical protein